MFREIPVHAMKPCSESINTDPLILKLSTEVSGYSKAPVTLHMGHGHGTHWMKGRMGPRTGMVVPEKRKLSCPYNAQAQFLLYSPPSHWKTLLEMSHKMLYWTHDSRSPKHAAVVGENNIFLKCVCYTHTISAACLPCCHLAIVSSGVPRNFVRGGGGSTNSVEGRGQT
jgi:hypothetical protein